MLNTDSTLLDLPVAPVVAAASDFQYSPMLDADSALLDLPAAPVVAAEAFAFLCTPLAPWHALRLGPTLHDYQGAQVNAASRSPYPDECVGKLVCDTFCLAQG